MKLMAALLLSTLFLGCGNGGSGDDIPCTDEEFWDQVNEVCVPRYRDENSEQNTMTADAGTEDMGDDEPEPDMAPAEDMASNNNQGGECDKDNDGVDAESCGGMDCNDNDPLQSPNNPEFCDAVDNNCNTVNNEGLQCSFYAHSGSTLYSIDPFEMTLTELTSDLPNLQDIDTHPNGTLLGVTFDGLYEFDELRDTWFFVGEFNANVQDPNGMAIDSTGRIFVTAQDEIFEIDIVDGSASKIGDLGEDFYSSGDCVVNKRDSLFMTSKHDPNEDYLLLVNRDNGSAGEIGPIGFQKVYALTAAWGNLYGLTDQAELIQIDSMTGEGTLLHQFPDQDLRFFGAASTPSR